MLLTEAEARTKWCPYARVLWSEQTVVDRNGPQEGGGVAATAPNRDAAGFSPERLPGACCIASECMAWRWQNATHVQFFHTCADASATAEPERPEAVPASWLWVPRDEDDPDSVAGWEEPGTVAHARRRGFCGLAGRPE